MRGAILRTGEQNNSTVFQSLNDHQVNEEEMGSVGELSKVRSQIVLNVCISHALGDLIFFGSVNKLARAITNWTRACDKRLACFISYIHHTCELLSCGKHRTTMQVGTVSRL